MNLQNGKKIFFISDVHLGAPNAAASLVREQKLVKFLDTIRYEAQEIILVGDLFDFWYEYKHVVPRGYVRLLGKLAELSDSGIQIRFFVGNHDMWMKNYFQQELNIPVYFHPASFEFGNKKFYVAHGDGLGPGDHGYKFLKKIFRNPLCQWLFGMLPPSIGIGLANFFSRKSREAVAEHEKKFLGPEKEWLMIHSREVLQREHYDYFVYGHRHVAIVYPIQESSTYVNLGDWVLHFTYAVWDGQELKLLKFE